MASQADIIHIAPDSRCPCRSGKVTAECCMAADGTFRVKLPALLPSGATTGFSHSQCYMQGTRNCSEDVSREHHLSKSVRDLLRDGTVDAGFPWNDAGRGTGDIETPPSGILCVRHNDALAPLDAVAVRAFDNLLEATVYVTRKSLATKRALYAVSGEGLELWALKFLFGAYHAALAAENGDAPKEAHPLDSGIFLKALEDGALTRPCGLYARSVGRMGKRVGWEASAPGTQNRVANFRFLVGPVEFELIVDPVGQDFDVIRRHNFYRPSAVDLIGRKRNANILLSGPTFSRNESVRLVLGELQ